MGYSKEQLLARLKDLQVEFSQYEHPPVMTVEAQAQYVGNLGGGLSKNLFLKDKKHRLYIVSALADTKVDMKVLSQRLGLGKGGLRMAPEESLLEILQVPLGSVTPFALVNESARDVGLLLDKGFKAQEQCFFHPLSNDMSVSLHTNDLDKFLKSIGRDPAYVDLEANPAVGKDQPPDLAAFVPSGSTVLPDPPEKASALQGASGDHVVANSNFKAVTEKAVKPFNKVQNVKEKSANVVHPSNSFTDAEKFVEEILDKISTQLLAENKEVNTNLRGEELGTEITNRLKSKCCSELKNLATIFKNTAYTQGFHAGKASSMR
ncbi:Prolyl-tRNA synthetase associated domain-containing protein 1 [Melia azedarach]|uniref:Prolyl-tRNA synthetase associated domain-containing protein 1 n=1 Tax=Melia azedarach TaxID=155640 RepID=A0ACC1WP40_MELAZ|nr:Prolyl-tRNA synthetase associated domain-containing protein 1 [Melia azedarach]